MILVVDTGPLVAGFNKKDRAHEMCTELLATTSAQLIVPAPVLTEVCYLVETRNGTRAEAAFLTELAGGTMHGRFKIGLLGGDLRTARGSTCWRQARCEELPATSCAPSGTRPGHLPSTRRTRF